MLCFPKCYIFFLFHVIALGFACFHNSARISKSPFDSSTVFFPMSIFHTGRDVKDSQNLPHRLPVLIFTHKTQTDVFQTHRAGTDQAVCFMTSGRILPDSEREHWQNYLVYGQYGKSIRGLMHLIHHTKKQGVIHLLWKSYVLDYGLCTWEKCRHRLVLETQLIAKRICL